MDWEQVIDSLIELVKDEEVRTNIYNTLLTASEEVDEDYVVINIHGIDDAFDNAWVLYQDSFEIDEEDEDEEDEEDNDYETDEDWSVEESEE